MKNIEIEFKYDAKELTMASFKDFCKDKGLSELDVVSGTDHFYSKPDNTDEFCRIRTGGMGSTITFKKKGKNEYIRTEHEIDTYSGQEPIRDLLGFLGYKHTKSIFKNALVGLGEWYTLAYYVCYDDNLKESGRYLELEINEKYPWDNQDQAYKQLLILEKICSPLGASPSKRIKKSLFELHGVTN